MPPLRSRLVRDRVRMTAMLLAAVAVLALGVRPQVDGRWRSPVVEYGSEALHAARQIHDLASSPDGTLFASTDVGLLAFDGIDWTAVGTRASAFAVGVTAGEVVVSGCSDGLAWCRVGAAPGSARHSLEDGPPFRAACALGGRIYLTRRHDLVAVEDDGRGGARIAGRWRPDGITLPLGLEFVKPVASGDELFVLLADPSDPQRTALAVLLDDQLFQVIPAGQRWMVDAASAVPGQLVVCTADAGCVEVGLDGDGAWREFGAFGDGLECLELDAVAGRGLLCTDAEGGVTMVGLGGEPIERVADYAVSIAHTDRFGRVWLAAGGTIRRVHVNAGVLVADVDRGGEVLGVCEGPDGAVWAATRHGLSCLHPRPTAGTQPLIPLVRPAVRSRTCRAAAAGRMVFSSPRSTRLLDVATGASESLVSWPCDAAAIGEDAVAVVSDTKLRVMFATASGWRAGRDYGVTAPVRDLALTAEELWVITESGAGRKSVRGVALDSGRSRCLDAEVCKLVRAFGGVVGIDRDGRLLRLDIESGARPLFEHRAGLRVRTAAGTEEALWLIAENDPEVAIGLDRHGSEVGTRYFPRAVTGSVVRELVPLTNGDLILVAAGGVLAKSQLEPPTHVPPPRLRRIESAADDGKGEETSWVAVAAGGGESGDPLELGPGALRVRLCCSDTVFPESYVVEARLSSATERGPWVPVVDGWAELFNLWDGDYRFEARTRAPGGGVAMAEILRVRVPSPWHRRWWFYVLSVALLGGVVGWAVRWRFARERGRVTALEAEVQHRRSVEAQLADAHETLRAAQGLAVQQERLQALGELAAGVAHDINNSLTPVLGYSEMLAVDAPMDDQARRECAGMLWRSARDIAAVVDRLSHLYRPALDRPEPVAVSEIFAETKALARPKWCDEALRRGVRIQVETEPSDLSLVCIPSRLRDALMNLVINSVDAIPAPGGTIRLRAQKVERRVVIEVSDDGVGMSPEDLSRCLQPFYSTKGADGTGLGLSNCQAIAAEHGGELAVESAPGGGTQVRLMLPLRQVAPAAAEDRAPLGAWTSVSILLVDDDERVRRAVRDQLKHLGHRVTCVADGPSALAEIEAGDGAFDILVTDQGMPGMTGADLIARVQQADPSVGTILISGWGDAQADASAEVYLSKPTTLDSFRDAIRRVLDARAGCDRAK